MLLHRCADALVYKMRRCGKNSSTIFLRGRSTRQVAVIYCTEDTVLEVINLEGSVGGQKFNQALSSS